MVRELDHFQYRKMRKLMYLDEQQQPVTTMNKTKNGTIRTVIGGTTTPSEGYSTDILEVRFCFMAFNLYKFTILFCRRSPILIRDYQTF